MASKIKQKKKQAQKKKPLLQNPTFYIFLILIVVVTNLRSNPALDKELEIRVLGVSVFLTVVGLFSLLSKKKSQQKVDISLLKNPFVILYALYIILNGISIFIAINKGEAIHGFLKIFTFGLLFLYLALFVLPKEESRTIFLKTAVLLSLIVGTIGIVQGYNIFTEHGVSIKSAYMIVGNYAHKNIFSEIAFIVLAFSAYSTYFFRGLWQKGAILGIILNLLVILMLVTRAVWVAFFISLIVTFIIYQLAIRKQKGKATFSKSFKYTFISILLIGIVSGTFFKKLDSNNSIKKHILEATDFTKGNTYHRLNIWKKSIPIIKEHPLMGVGTGNWKVEISKYDVALYYSNNGWVMPRRTHNDYINIASETGIIGLLLFLAMFGVLIFYLINLIHRSTQRSDSLFYSILFFILIGYMTFSFFNFTKERVDTQILMNVLFAFVVFEFKNNSKQKKHNFYKLNNIRVAGIILLLPVILTAISAQQRVKTEALLNKAYATSRGSSKKEIEIAYKILKDINTPFVTLSPMNDPIPSLQAVSMLRRKMDKNEIINKYKEGLKIFPYHIRTLNELAYVFKQQKENDSSLYYNGLALKYAPSNPKIVLDQVIYLQQNRQPNKAFELLGTVEQKNQNQRYKEILYAYLKQKTIKLLANENQKLITYYGTNYAKSKKALLSLFRQSQKGKNTFETLFLTQVSKRIKKKDPKGWSRANKNLFKRFGVKLTE